MPKDLTADGAPKSAKRRTGGSAAKVPSAEAASSEPTRAARRQAAKPAPKRSAAENTAGRRATEEPRAAAGPGPMINGVSITHPDRVFWPTPGVTKSDLVRYYDMVAERMLPYVLNRPIAMLRCPSGVEDGEAQVAQVRQRGGGPGGCFFHKHPADDFPGPSRPGDDHRVGRPRSLPDHHRPWKPHRSRPDGGPRDPHLGLHVARHRAARHDGVRPGPGPGASTGRPSRTARAWCVKSFAPCTWRASSRPPGARGCTWWCPLTP